MKKGGDMKERRKERLDSSRKEEGKKEEYEKEEKPRRREKWKD
jgi:hypothetical protein